MKSILCCVALLCLIGSAHAQSSNTTNGMAIGSTVPDMAITGIINQPSSTGHLSDYKGKLLILDFWATWCSPCIASLPKTDSLNKAFAGKAVILPVTFQKQEDVTKVFAKLPPLRNLKIPMVVNDEKLHTLFPHSELPHYVWIDQQGKVIAITDHSAVTATNIKKCLQAGSIVLREKKDIMRPKYYREVPLMFNAVEFEPADIRYEVLFTGYKAGFAYRLDVLRHPDRSIARVSITNLMMHDLYQLAYSTDKHALYDKEIIIEVKNKTPFIAMGLESTDAEEERHNREDLYCFEMITPPGMSQNFLDLMKTELDRLFPQYVVGMEKRDTKCYALERTSSVDKLKSKGGKTKYDLGQFDISIKNGPIEILLGHYNQMTLRHLELPIVDNTGYTDLVDLNLEGNNANLDNVRMQLKKYDLALVERTLPINLLVIRDRQ